MDSGDKATPVARREFYSALVLVWTFIMLAFSTTLFRGSPSPFSTPAAVIYLAVSLLMVANYSIALLRSDGSRKRVVLVALLAVVALVVGAVAYLAGRIPN